jgi:hypothetical protein
MQAVIGYTITNDGRSCAVELIFSIGSEEDYAFGNAGKYLRGLKKTCVGIVESVPRGSSKFRSS